MKKDLGRWGILITAAVFLSIPRGLAAETQLDSSFIYPEYSKTISMDFKDALLNDVLKIFSQQSGLNFIAAQSIADRKITLYLDKVPVEEALERILAANGLAYEIQPGSNVFLVKTAPTTPGELVTRVFTLKNASVNSSKLKSLLSISPDVALAIASDSGSSSQTSQTGGIAPAIQAVLSANGKLVEDPRTNSLIITDIPAQFPLIEQTIARLDVSVPQILIEAEMLDISKETSELMGVKFSDTVLSYGANANDVPANRFFRGINSMTQPYRLGTINASGLTAVLNFLKTRTDTKNLARPRILTLNNETAQIKITVDEAIGLKSVSQTTAGSQVLTTAEAERKETGVILTVTPQANATTREITMAVVPKVIQARTGGTFQGQTFKDPEERGTKSLLRIRDNETVIIGGLLRNDISDSKTKLPILGDIPFLGAPFRHRNATNQQRELIIFLTPHILAEDTAEVAMAAKPEKLLREQEMPASRLSEIDKALGAAERK